MKLDDNVKMISAEAPMLFSKAAEIFINELTLRAWIHTEDNRRRTLQRNDIAMAITKYDQFDFLIDIVPREEAKIVTKGIADIKTTLNPEQVIIIVNEFLQLKKFFYYKDECIYYYYINVTFGNINVLFFNNVFIIYYKIKIIIN